MNNKDLAKEVIRLVGGKDNVKNCFHCITRLRFSLLDSSRADREALRALEGVMGVVEQGGMFMVIIGTTVPKVFEEVEKELGTGVVETKSDIVEEKKNPFNRFLSFMCASFKPMFGLMAGSGVLKGLLALIAVLAPSFGDTNTYTVLYGISDAILYFMPVMIGAGAAKYLKIDSFLGGLIGATLMYPDIISISGGEVSGSIFGMNIVVEKIFGIIPYVAVNYSSSLFPALVAVAIAAPVYRWCKKKVPDILQLFLTPLLTLAVSVLVTLVVFGPIVSVASAFIGWVLNAIYNFAPWLCGLAVGGPWIIMVMCGLHTGFIPVLINEIMSSGSSVILGFLGANQMAMTGALFAVMIRSKSKKTKSMAGSTGLSCFLGVSEPGLYSTLVPSKIGLVWAVIGGSLGGMVAAIMGARLYALGVSGIMQTTLAINSDNMLGFAGYCISLVIGFAVSFAGTYISFNEKTDKLLNAE